MEYHLALGQQRTVSCKFFGLAFLGTVFIPYVQAAILNLHNPCLHPAQTLGLSLSLKLNLNQRNNQEQHSMTVNLQNSLR